MPIIDTFGHTKKGMGRFIRLLEEAGVDAFIDVRLRNTSQLAGFAKRDDLAFLLRKGIGLDYEHRLELAPTGEILDSFREDDGWSAYEEAFQSLLTTRDADEIGLELLARYRHPCLLCAETLPDHCHRCLIAESWASQLSDVEVVHLV